VFRVVSEQPASVEMQDEDRHDEDNDERGAEEKDDRQEAGLVRGLLLQLHAGLDAVFGEDVN
jgi:hypothetical protein